MTDPGHSTSSGKAYVPSISSPPRSFRHGNAVQQQTVPSQEMQCTSRASYATSPKQRLMRKKAAAAWRSMTLRITLGDDEPYCRLGRLLNRWESEERGKGAKREVHISTPKHMDLIAAIEEYRGVDMGMLATDMGKQPSVTGHYSNRDNGTSTCQPFELVPQTVGYTWRLRKTNKRGVLLVAGILLVIGFCLFGVLRVPSRISEGAGRLRG